MSTATTTTTTAPPPPPPPPAAQPPLSLNSDLPSAAPADPQPLTTAATSAAASPAAPDPGSSPANEVAVSGAGAASYTITIPSCSAWFSWDEIHDTERRLLPDFFNNKNRNPRWYKYYRDSIVRRFRANPSRRLSFTDARRGLIGDVGSIRRVFDFLEDWGLINYTPSVVPSSSASAGKEKREEDGVASMMGEKDGGGGAAAAKICSNCKASCTVACFVTEKADIVLCARCYVHGKYRPGLSSADFKRLDINEEAKTEWTDRETLHLLEAVLHYGDDWKKVSDHVGGRSEKDCVARFIKLPFAEQFLGPSGTTPDSWKHESEEKMSNTDGDHTSEQLSPKRMRLTPLADASNPIMAQVAFLSSIVGSDIAKSTAQAAIVALTKYEMPGSSMEEVHKVPVIESEGEDYQQTDKVLSKAVKEARLLVDKEENEVEQYLSDIVEVQMKEIQEKIQNFEELELLLEKERLQLSYMKDLSFADQLGLIQHQRQSKIRNK